MLKLPNFWRELLWNKQHFSEFFFSNFSLNSHDNTFWIWPENYDRRSDKFFERTMKKKSFNFYTRFKIEAISDYRLRLAYELQKHSLNSWKNDRFEPEHHSIYQ